MVRKGDALLLVAWGLVDGDVGLGQNQGMVRTGEMPLGMMEWGETAENLWHGYFRNLLWVPPPKPQWFKCWLTMQAKNKEQQITNTSMVNTLNTYFSHSLVLSQFEWIALNHPLNGPNILHLLRSRNFAQVPRWPSHSRAPVIQGLLLQICARQKFYQHVRLKAERPFVVNWQQHIMANLTYHYLPLDAPRRMRLFHHSHQSVYTDTSLSQTRSSTPRINAPRLFMTAVPPSVWMGWHCLRWVM